MLKLSSLSSLIQFLLASPSIQAGNISILSALDNTRIGSTEIEHSRNNPNNTYHNELDDVLTSLNLEGTVKNALNLFTSGSLVGDALVTVTAPASSALAAIAAPSGNSISFPYFLYICFSSYDFLFHFLKLFFSFFVVFSQKNFSIFNILKSIRKLFGNNIQ